MTWHPLSESYPSDLTLVLLTDGREVAPGIYSSGTWTTQAGDLLELEPTHWMPIPTLPEPKVFVGFAGTRLLGTWGRDDEPS